MGMSRPAQRLWGENEGHPLHPFAARVSTQLYFDINAMLSRFAAAICEVCFKQAGDLKQSNWEQSDLLKHLQSELDQAPG